MRLVYQPEGQPEPQEWTVDLGRLRSQEVEQIEKLTGLDYGSDYKTRLMKGNSLARRALLYTLQRRAHPHIRWTDVDFADAELVLAFDLPELREIHKAVMESSAVPEAERPAVLEELERQISAAEAVQGKALTQTVESATG